MRRLLAVLLVLPLATGLPLAAQTTPAPIEGERADVDRLAGDWVGGYDCDATGRHGTVVVRLAAGADSVEAVVLMVPRARDGDLVPAPIPLALHRVTVNGRSFRGVLARYEDPEWGLPLETEFGGLLKPDGTIEGTFRAVGTRIDTMPQVGRWWARRASEPQAAR